jgi:uncharacterized membrane protein YgaE (UPF0421/DUF939 family)
MGIELLLGWCIEAQDCTKGDMSNIFATILGIVVGIVIGTYISLLIYRKQQKTSEEQDKILKHIDKLEEYLLEKTYLLQQNHDNILKNISILDKKIDSLLENKKYF